MAEFLTIANVKKIVDLAIAIKRAVDTARRNERACRRVEGTVSRVCGLMQMLGTNPAHVAMLQHPCVAGALDDVVDSLEEALVLVGKCQKKSTFLQIATASGTASKLKAIQDELLQKVSLCTLMVTTMSAVAMTDNRPQLSRQFDNPSSRSELALQLRDTYTNGEGISSTCFEVTDNTMMGVAFAFRASGIDFLIQLDNQLFGIRPIPTAKSTNSSPSDPLFDLVAPFGEEAICHGTVCLWGGLGDFNPYTLAEVFTTPFLRYPRRTRRSAVKIQEIDDDIMPAPAAPLPLLLPGPVATDDSSHLPQD